MSKKLGNVLSMAVVMLALVGIFASPMPCHAFTAYYDVANRLSLVVYDEYNIFHYVYDPAGNLLKIIEIGEDNPDYDSDGDGWPDRVELLEHQSLDVMGKVLSINPAVINLPASASSGHRIEIEASLPWQAETSHAWILITSGAEGSGNGEVLFEVLANEDSERIGSITVALQDGDIIREVTIQQSGQSVHPQGSFEEWVANRALSGEIGDLFRQIASESGVANGFVYAFGDNLPANGVMLKVRTIEDRQVVEIPSQDLATIPYVRVWVSGTTNLQDWNLSVDPAQNVQGKPDNRDWHEPEGEPGRAFFKLEAELQ